MCKIVQNPNDIPLHTYLLKKASLFPQKNLCFLSLIFYNTSNHNLSSILLLFNNLWHIIHQGLWLIINPYQYLYISWGAVHSSKGTLFNWMWMSYRPSLNKSPDHFATCRNTHIQGEKQFDQNISYSLIETAWAIHSFLMSNINWTHMKICFRWWCLRSVWMMKA